MFGTSHFSLRIRGLFFGRPHQYLHLLAQNNPWFSFFLLFLCYQSVADGYPETVYSRCHLLNQNQNENGKQVMIILQGTSTSTLFFQLRRTRIASSNDSECDVGAGGHGCKESLKKRLTHSEYVVGINSLPFQIGRN